MTRKETARMIAMTLMSSFNHRDRLGTELLKTRLICLASHHMRVQDTQRYQRSHHQPRARKGHRNPKDYQRHLIVWHNTKVSRSHRRYSRKIHCKRRTKTTTRSQRKAKKKVRRKKKMTSMCSRAPREIALLLRASNQISDIATYSQYKISRFTSVIPPSSFNYSKIDLFNDDTKFL